MVEDCVSKEPGKESGGSFQIAGTSRKTAGGKRLLLNRGTGKPGREGGLQMGGDAKG